MYIVDRNNDYYDYFSNIYGVDKGIVFDRRGSERINDAFLAQGIEPGRQKSRWWGSTAGHILLEIGTVQYLIEITDVKVKINMAGIEEFKSCKMRLIRTFSDNVNRFGSPLSVRRISVRYYWGKSKESILKKESFEEIFGKEPGGWSLESPILAGTQLTALIDPESVWRELMNYISSLNNDLDVSIPMTDVQKAEIHGFDKRTSFRHPVK